MEWVKLSAVPAYYHDGAVLRAGEAAEVLFCRAIAHCGSVESRGLVDKTVLPLLVPTKPQARADALVREGLWLDEGAHYRIRSWDKWQDQHDVAAEKRRKDRERQQDHRRKQREDASQDLSRGLSDGQSRDSHSDKSDSHYVDVDVDREKNKTSRPSAAEPPSGFAEFWLAYPRKDDKGRAIQAYRKALKTTDATTLAAAAGRYASERQGQDATFTKLPATWLNAQSWDNEAPAMSRDSEGRACPPGLEHLPPHERFLAVKL